MRYGTGTAVLAAAALVAGGCDGVTGPENGGNVAVAFSAVGAGAAASPAGGSFLAVRDLPVDGTNGTLVLEELRIIVEEFELDRLMDDDCNDDDACEKFEAGPLFVDVPLDGGEVVAVTAQVTPDTYDELEFEIDDLDDDSSVDNALLAEIRQTFPDWPRDASMLVTGTFTPTGGDPVPFRVYFEAEVEIEMELSPPVTITDDGSGATFTVNIDPAAWFATSGGGVLDLSQFDYDATGSVVEFEVEIEDGFTDVEFDDDDDDDDDGDEDDDDDDDNSGSG